MSEKAPQHSPESLHNIETSAEQLAKIRHELERQAEKQEAVHHNSVEELTQKVEQHAISGKEMGPSEVADKKQHPVLINKQLKDMAYSRTMVRVRKKLSVPSRALSKAVHSKVLDKPSEVIGKTVARPSSMLGGAIVAAFGTSLLLWITKKYGYEYNYLAILMLFIVGMIAGLAAEVVARRFKRR